MFFQDKNVFASKTLKIFKKFSETYILKLAIPNFCKTRQPLHITYHRSRLRNASIDEIELKKIGRQNFF